MSKFYHPTDQMDTKGHWAVGTVWSVDGSKNNVYNVEMADRGFHCNCPAFRKCKHINGIVEGFCTE